MRRWIAVALVVACNKGGSPKQLAVFEGSCNGLAADATYVYLTTMDLGNPHIARIPRQGGQPETLIKTAVAWGVVVDGGRLYWGELASEDPSPGPIVVTLDQIQSGEVGKIVSAGVKHFGRLMSAPVSGGEATQLARYDGVPIWIAVDDRAVYALSIGVYGDTEIDTTRGSLVATPKAGGALSVLVDRLRKPSDLVQDATHLYWTSGGATFRIAKLGGTVESAPNAPTPAYVSQTFEKAFVDGKTRYRCKSESRTTTVTAEPL